MTRLICDVESIVGQKIDGIATLASKGVSPSPNEGAIVLPDPVEEEVVQGVAVFENAAPGNATLRIEWDSRSVTLRFTIPDTEEITLADALADAIEWEPPIVSQVAANALAARQAQEAVEGIIADTEWEGDRLRVLGELSPPLTGPAPEMTVSSGGTWVVDGVDTGHPAQGEKGDTPELEVSATGTWVIDGQDTGSPARGPEGYTPTVQGGTWHVGGVDTGYPASVGLVEDPDRPGMFIPETLDMSGAGVGVEDVAGLTAALAGKSAVGHKHPVTDLTATGTRSASTYLRGDGSWTTPPDTKYSLPTKAEAEAGTSTTARVWSAQRVAQAVAAGASGAAPADHTHTPEQVGAAPADHTHTPQEIGAAPADHSHTPGQVGAAPADHSHTPAEVGAAPATHKHPVTDITATGTRSSTTYLRGDGSWTTPTNTTYSVPSQAEAQAGTATTGRAFSAQRVAQAIDARAAAKTHSHTLQQVTGLNTALDGKAPMPVEVTGDNWPTTGPPGTIYWQEED